MEKMTVSQAKKAISDKLSHFFGVDTKTATDNATYIPANVLFRVYVVNSELPIHLDFASFQNNSL